MRGVVCFILFEIGNKCTRKFHAVQFHFLFFPEIIISPPKKKKKKKKKKIV